MLFVLFICNFTESVMILHAQDCTQHFTELELWKSDNALDTVQVATYTAQI